MHRIEITGLSMDELRDNVLSLAAMMSSTANITSPPVKTKEPAIVEQVTEELETAPVVTEETKPAPRRRSRPAAEAPAETKPAPKQEPEVTEATLRNLVLKLMQAKGRDAVEAVLGEFGIKRATEVDAARASELVAAFEDAIAA